jgi:hypothetical protein
MTALYASSSKIGQIAAASASTKKCVQVEETRAELVRRGAVGRRFAVVGLPLGSPAYAKPQVKPRIDYAELARQLALLGFDKAENETKATDRHAGVAC